MPKKRTDKPVGDALYQELRYKLLAFFSDVKVNYDVDSQEPFKADIEAGRYTTIQQKEMVRALYKAGLLLEAPASQHPNRIVYGLTPLGRHALNEWQKRS